MMSFLPSLWRTSKLDQLLENQTQFSLEMLDQDDILEETRLMNDKLIKILSDKTSITILFDHMLNGPLPAAQGLSNPNRYSAISCEIIQLGISSIDATIIESPELLEQLFSFVKKTAPIPSFNAILFCKTALSLIERHKQEIFDFWKERKWIVERLVDHISADPFGDFILSVFKLDQIEPVGFATLFQEINFLDGVLKLLDKSNSDEAQQSAAQFLLNLVHISTFPSNLVHMLDSPENIEKLLEPCLNGLVDHFMLRLPSPLGTGSVDVVTSLLKWYAHNSASYHAAKKAEDPQYTAELSSCLSGTGAVQVISKHLPELTQLLMAPAELDRRGKKAVGTAKLKLLQMFVAYVNTISHNPTAVEDCIKLSIPNMALDLLFTYEWNNFLHHQVEEMLRIILESSEDKLKQNLFENAKLATRLIAAFDDTEPKGYLGHLARISHNLVINNSVQQYLFSATTEWQDFTLGKLHRLYRIETAKLGEMDLVEFFPELRDELLRGMGEAMDIDEEVDPNSSHILSNDEGEEYTPPKEPQWV